MDADLGCYLYRCGMGFRLSVPLLSNLMERKELSLMHSNRLYIAAETQ